ncbi:MAG: hypothetical protein MJ185_09360 [Treponema sp.]|nr:hypothetical protein [Treponema sp.]
MFVPGSSFSKAVVASVILIVCIDMSFAIKNKLENEINYWNKKYKTVQEYQERKNVEALDAPY